MTITVLYVAETWEFSKSLESKLMLMEMDFLGDRRDPQQQKTVKNNVIREKMNIKNSVLDYIKYKQLNWYGHLQRMNEERLFKKN